ncbi:MAG: MFS transporter, partial [Ardenticatenia bacterium]
MRGILRNPLFLAISIGHMMVDVLNSAIPIILATLAIQLGLRNEQLGLAALVYSFGGSLTQPLFGYVADRWGSRWLAAGGLWWMAGFYLIAALLSPQAAFVVLLLVGLGSAAYHPQATMNARLASGDMAASGTSLFFLNSFGVDTLYQLNPNNGIV